MYPRLIEIPITDGFTLTIYSFGFMVAVAILTAAWLTGRELDRKQADGLIGKIKLKGKDGKPRNARPSEIMGTVTIIAAVFGVLGSKLFHILENLDQFMQDPTGMLFSTGGLTFYGGLICAGLAVAWYVRKNGVQVGHMADAVAPGLLLAYGIGRIGCHLAGDGDWGIASNLADKPGWIPTWLWQETYPNNILGVDLSQAGVYPTSIYEFLMIVVLFGALWVLRKHTHKAGWLFGMYLVFTGAERYLIEQIRVNNVFDFLGMLVTQAEVISSILILVGVLLMMRTWKKGMETPKATPAPSA